MQELLPNLQTEFNRLKSGIVEVLETHGFQNIETPTIERMEILLAKAGGETARQIYKVVKTEEGADDADQALRFDHTVPLARYVVEHMNELTFPFRVSQVGRNFRGERAQKGRFREFYQCDADVIGWETLPIAYDAEAIGALIEAMRVLPLPSFVVRVSNRKLLAGLMEELNLEGQAAEIFGIVDHAEKVPQEQTVQALEELRIGSEKIEKIISFIGIHGGAEEVVAKLREFGFENEKFQEGIAELAEVLNILEYKVALTNDDQPKTSVTADMLIVRGLDYYTGTVFETIVPEYREIGSICSGGRYENLAENYTERTLPGVGGSIGLTRLFSVLRSYSFIELEETKPVEICVVPVSRAEFEAAEKLAVKLRASGKRVDVILTDKKLGDKLKYADKVAEFGVVVGEDEVKTGKYKLKNFQSGEVTALAL